MENNVNMDIVSVERAKGSDFKCFIGVHKYDVHSTHPLMDTRNMNLGVVIVNRCNNCGKIRNNKIITVDGRY